LLGIQDALAPNGTIFQNYLKIYKKAIANLYVGVAEDQNALKRAIGFSS